MIRDPRGFKPDMGDTRMIRNSGWGVLAVVAGVLVLAGCAQAGGVKSAPPATTIVAAPPVAAAPVSTTKIPEYKGKPVVAADTKDHFNAVAAAIRQQMGAGGRFSFVTKDGRASVDSHLNDMGTLFDQYGSVSKMPPLAQSKIDTDQNAINEVLARYDGNRVVCHEETPVGTHFPKRVCLTLRQIQQQSNQSQQMLRQSSMHGSEVGGTN